MLPQTLQRRLHVCVPAAGLRPLHSRLEYHPFTSIAVFRGPGGRAAAGVLARMRCHYEACRYAGVQRAGGTAAVSLESSVTCTSQACCHFWHE